MSIQSAVHEAARVRNREGVQSVIVRTLPFLYRNVWKHLPRSSRLTKAGVPVGEHERLTDSILPDFVTETVPQSQPSYESQYLPAVREAVRHGDDVVAVGGGWGVSAVVAGQAAGEDGHVTVFEGSKPETAKVRRTAALNGVADRVTVRHAVVGRNISLRGPMAEASTIPATDLPSCDTLLIDCDGAEFDILSALEIRPRSIVVEHHAVPGEDGPLVAYDPGRIESLLDRLAYRIGTRRHHPTQAFGRDELVLVATHRDGGG